MTESLRLGTVLGVRVGLNWSVLAIFALVVYGLTAVVLPEVYPAEPTAARAVAGLLTALAFFASLLAHELSHALVARREGLRCDRVVLWMFGGVALLRGEVRTPGADLRIAGVGPLVSFVLAVVLGAVAFGASALGFSGLALGCVYYLAFTNLVLAVFNLVPAAPLDGGRLLRAAVWRVRGDRFSAAVVAGRAGQVFGVVLMGWGVYRVLDGDLTGAWPVLLGLFVVRLAGLEAQQARVSQRLDGVVVSDVTAPPPEWAGAPGDAGSGAGGSAHRVRADARLVDVLPSLQEHGGALVTDVGGAVVGVVDARAVHEVLARARTAA